MLHHVLPFFNLQFDNPFVSFDFILLESRKQVHHCCMFYSTLCYHVLRTSYNVLLSVKTSHNITMANIVMLLTIFITYFAIPALLFPLQVTCSIPVGIMTCPFTWQGFLFL